MVASDACNTYPHRSNALDPPRMSITRVGILHSLQALVVGATLLASASVAAAQSPAVGDVAPEFARGAQWVMNEPDRTPTIADLQGEVVVIAHWGTRCGPSVRMLPQLQKLHRDYAARGPARLHIRAPAVERRADPQDPSRIVAGADYAVSRGGCSTYSGTGYIPIAWVIGVNGRIAFVGHPARPAFTGAINDPDCSRAVRRPRPAGRASGGGNRRPALRQWRLGSRTGCCSRSAGRRRSGSRREG